MHNILTFLHNIQKTILSFLEKITISLKTP
jgi:hypothetical protein